MLEAVDLEHGALRACRARSGRSARPRSTRARRASTGSGSAVFSPSESRTTPPSRGSRGPVPAARSRRSTAPGASTSTGLPTIALSDVCRPLPSAVPPAGCSRSIAASTLARSAVGCWVTSPLPPNATTPIRTVGGWRSTNGARRGLRGVQPGRARGRWRPCCVDTSKASITVPSRRGCGTPTSGRASAASSSTRRAEEQRRAARAAAARDGGRARPGPARPARRAGAARGPQQPPVPEHEQRHGGEARAASTATSKVSHRAARRSRRAPQLRDAEQGPHQVVVGGDRMQVEPGRAQVARRRAACRSSAAAASRCRNPGSSVSTKITSPVSASST